MAGAVAAAGAGGIGIFDDNAMMSRRDLLVQQLLEERRQRLEQKLASDPGMQPASPVAQYASPIEQYAFRETATMENNLQYVEQYAFPETATLENNLQYAATPSSSSRGLQPASPIAQFAIPEPPATWANMQRASTPSSTSRGRPSMQSEHNYVHESYGNSRSSRPQSAGASTRRAPTPNSAGRSSQRLHSEYDHVAESYGNSRSSRARPSSAGRRDRPASQNEHAHASESPGNSTASRPRSAPPAKTAGRNFNSKLQEWTLRHQATNLKQQHARQEKEEQEMMECTFKPSINTKSEFYARRSRGCYMETLPKRLHHEADKRATLRQKAKELLEADEMCSYTFQPRINRSEGVRQTPIHLRAEEIQQQRQERSAAREAAEAVRSDCSFQPRISEKSDRIVRKKRDEMYRSLSQGRANYAKVLGPVEDRLYAGAQDLQQRRIARTEGSATEGSQSTPSVDHASRRICKASIYFQGPQQDFVTRQQTFELAKQRRQEVRTQHAETEYTFKPEISDVSRQIISGNIEFVGETADERVHRLAVRDVERRDQVRGALEELHYRECTFKPTLNPNSQALAAKFDDAASYASSDSCGAVHERLYKAGQNRSRWNENSSMEECTFAPALSARTSKKYAHVKSRYRPNGSNIMDNIQEELQRREEQLSEKRREIESEKAAECTFNPEIRKPYEEPQSAVIVSGLGRFFELRDLAKKQQQEQQEREVKAFHPEKNAKCDGVTIPEPFALSSGLRDSRRDENSAPGSAECTFTPYTNESENRRLLQEIMSKEGSVIDWADQQYDSTQSFSFSEELLARRSSLASTHSPYDRKPASYHTASNLAKTSR